MYGVLFLQFQQGSRRYRHWNGDLRTKFIILSCQVGRTAKQRQQQGQYDDLGYRFLGYRFHGTGLVKVAMEQGCRFLGHNRKSRGYVSLYRQTVAV
ncbi:hypothetical protein, partial [Thiolapillus sp.]|uniref:hypothetical protein n=1 Tax=Thiolapillus sp. TaxID=2017437 RepID=UPI003AF548BD